MNGFSVIFESIRNTILELITGLFTEAISGWFSGLLG